MASDVNGDSNPRSGKRTLDYPYLVRVRRADPDFDKDKRRQEQTVELVGLPDRRFKRPQS